MTESLSCRNQSINLFSKSMDWFLHDRDSVMKELIGSDLLNIRNEIWRRSQKTYSKSSKKVQYKDGSSMATGIKQ